jgi:hypothetical protein
MKKVLMQSVSEEAVYYSDFNGTLLTDCMVPCEVKVEFSYPSKCDGESMTLHLSDSEAKELLLFIKNKLMEETQEQYDTVFKQFDL